MLWTATTSEPTCFAKMMCVSQVLKLSLNSVVNLRAMPPPLVPASVIIFPLN
jgi:hypothetical protein